eukprot:jgi/Botrbrau1/2060/Bobra.0047s0027.3
MEVSGDDFHCDYQRELWDRLVPVSDVEEFLGPERSRILKFVVGKLRSCVEATVAERDRLHTLYLELAESSKRLNYERETPCDPPAHGCCEPNPLQAAAELDCWTVDKPALCVEVILQSLQDDIDVAVAELARLKGFEQSQDLVIEDLSKKHDALANERNVWSNQENVLRPHLTKLEEAVQERRAALIVNQEELQRASTSSGTAVEHYNAILREMSTIQGAIKAEAHGQGNLVRDFEKARKSADGFSNAIRLFQAQCEDLERRVVAEDAPRLEYESVASVKEGDALKLQSALEKARRAIQAKLQSELDLLRQLEVAKAEAEHIVSDQINVDLEAQKLEVLTKHELDEGRRRLKERNKVEGRLRVQLRYLKQVQESQLTYLSRLSRASTLITVFRHEQCRLQRAVGTVKEDIDLLINSFLAEQQKGEGHNGMYKALHDHIQTLEGAIVLLRRQNEERSGAHLQLLGESNRLGRQFAERNAKGLDKQRRVSSKLFELNGLKSWCKTVNQQTTNFRQLISLLKERETMVVLLIKAAGEKSAYLRELSLNMNSEIKALVQTSDDKQRQLKNELLKRDSLCKCRDSLREEVQRTCRRLTTRQEALEGGVRIMQQLKTRIIYSERAAEGVLQNYAAAVVQRNNVGIMLIDRVDEQCVLREKLHVLQHAETKGQVALMKLTAQLRWVSNSITNIERSKAIVQCLPHHVKSLDVLVTAMKCEWLRQERVSQDHALALEDPEGNTRWRFLAGEDESNVDLLTARVIMLEAGLAKKTGILQAQTTLLEYMQGEIDCSRVLCSISRGESFPLQQEVQAKRTILYKMSRRLKVLLSEVSLLHATAIRLESEKKAAIETLAESPLEIGAQKGESDNDEEFLAWQARLAPNHEKTSSSVKDDEVHGASFMRPLAYVSPDMGIPRPFGAFKPFKPGRIRLAIQHLEGNATILTGSTNQGGLEPLTGRSQNDGILSQAI